MVKILIYRIDDFEFRNARSYFLLPRAIENGLSPTAAVAGLT